MRSTVASLPAARTLDVACGTGRLLIPYVADGLDVDGCDVSPDMIALCGGLQNVGSGAEGTVKGARVLVSTATMSHSIADVYVCRKDFYDVADALECFD